MSFNDLSKLLINIVNDLAITEAAVFVKPRNNPLNINSTLLKKLDGLSQRVVALHSSTIEMIKKIAQILVRNRNRGNELLMLLLLPSFS